MKSYAGNSIGVKGLEELSTSVLLGRRVPLSVLSNIVSIGMLLLSN